MTDLVRQGTSSNFRFKCLHCGKSMSGAKTKLVDHFLGSGTPGCRVCPADVLATVRAERKDVTIGEYIPSLGHSEHAPSAIWD